MFINFGGFVNPMFLFKALEKSWKAVRKRKALFVLLFLSQMVFLSFFGYVQVKYQVEMAMDFQGIIAPLEEANYNVTSLQTGMPFTEQGNEIMGSWESLKANFMELMGFSFLIFAALNGLNWALSHYIAGKKKFLVVWGRFILLTGMFFLVLMLVNVLFFGGSVLQNDPVLTSQIMMGLAAVFGYFAWLSFSFADLKFKEIFRKVFWEIGIKRFYLVLVAYLLVLLFVGFFGSFVYQSVMGWSMWSVFLFIVLFVLAVNFSRIFLINSLREIS